MDKITLRVGAVFKLLRLRKIDPERAVTLLSIPGIKHPRATVEQWLMWPLASKPFRQLNLHR